VLARVIKSAQAVSAADLRSNQTSFKKGANVQYMIMNFVPAVAVDAADADAAHPDMAAWSAYTKAMLDAGVMRGGNALKPAHTATTVRLHDDRRDVHDGPYADSKEELGGYFIIDVPDLDEALKWAARNPAARSGAVEVRPIMSMG
jgi:hypothetical protein